LDNLTKKLSSFEAEGMTQNVSVQPSERAKKHRKHIVLPEGMTTELLLLLHDYYQWM
jgi:phosphate acetyltransferase